MAPKNSAQAHPFNPSNSQWNVPDWQDAAAYPKPNDLSLPEWRWQFLRRRKDYRDEFDIHAAPTYAYECVRTTASRKGRKLLVVPQGHPAFRASLEYLSVQDEDAAQDTFLLALSRCQRYDLACRLPNPRCITPLRLQFERPYGGFLNGPIQGPVRLSLREDQIMLTYCLSKPLAAQVQLIRDLLQRIQAHKYGKKVARRARRADWPLYLRVLDAKAAGVPLRVIGTTVLSLRGTQEQIATRVLADIYTPAYALGINFPY